MRPQSPTPEYVTFINPSLQKGAYPFVRIAHELSRRRPDIPILVVQSRGNRDTLAACGLDLGHCRNIRFMPNTNDPRQFWGVTKIALMPSLCPENQPLVAVEAMINGIPIIASDWGRTPETVGDGGLVLPLPARLTPVTHMLPTAEEVQPWVEAVIRLWDDAAFYETQSAKARHEAERWHPDRLRPLYADFFANVQPQPRPPFVARKCDSEFHDVHRRNGPPHHRRMHPPERPSAVPGSSRAESADGLLTFVICVSDDEVLKANFMASPCLAEPDRSHQVVHLRGSPNAAEALNFGIERARHH